MLKRLMANFLPHTCIACGKAAFDQDLCQGCYQDLPWLKNTYLQENIALFQYQYPINHWIIALKFHQQLLYAKLFGELLALRIKQIYQDSLPEVIIPVPLHRNRLRERGFNQSLELARELNKFLSIEINFNACQRIRNTQPQALIAAHQRHANMQGAFKCRTDFQAKHIAIIDDVVTTGETTHALRQVFIEREVKQIDIWCVAKA